MPIIRRSDCVPLPTVVCPVVAVVMLESRVARYVHCVENVACQATFSTQCTHLACSSNILHTVHTSCLLKQHSPHSAQILLAQATFSTQCTHLACSSNILHTVHTSSLLKQHSPHSTHILPTDSPASQQLTTGQTTIGSGTQLDLLMMGIKMPETF